MKQLCLYPVISSSEDQREMVTLSPKESKTFSSVLKLKRNGQLTVGPTESSSKQKPKFLLATLSCRQNTADDATWWLINHSQQLTVNGIRPLSLCALEPGDLIAVKQEYWMVTVLWTPEPEPVPEKLADRDCPVCGGKLKLAPVIPCACGRYYHLENPQEPDNTELLNCYLTSGACGMCHREPTLEQQLIPEPHEKMLDTSYEYDSAELAGV